jgi:hypothetical protein
MVVTLGLMRRDYAGGNHSRRDQRPDLQRGSSNGHRAGRHRGFLEAVDDRVRSHRGEPSREGVRGQSGDRSPQACTGTVHELANRGLREAQGISDLGATVAVNRGADQGSALPLRQAPDL